MGKYFVKRLEDIAFAASYREILGNLLLCPEHRPEDRRNMNSYSSLISVNPFFSGHNVRNFVRNRLDQHLIGTMNDDIRKRFVQEFFDTTCDTDGKTEVWVFLDCVLDDTFTELPEVPVSFFRSEPQPELIHVIARRSPHLTSLRLNFDIVLSKTPLAAIKPIISPLHSLECLTSLSLYHVHKRHRSVLSYVGKSCPRLAHLCVSGFRVKKKDIVALVLGELVHLLPKYEKQKLLEDEAEDIHTLRVFPEYLTPFCSTLERLQLEDTDRRKKLQANCEHSGLSATAVGFALRHMPHLTIIDHSGSAVSSAVKMLHAASTVEEPINEVRHVCREVDDPLESGAHLLTWAVNSPFTGQLSLTSLDFVNLHSGAMLKAVEALCPKLQEVSFCHAEHETATIRTEEIMTLLTTVWPKVNVVAFVKVSPSFFQAVLEAIGSQLQELTFASCEAIRFSHLCHCNELESLAIWFNSKLDDTNAVSFNSSFLPKLISLESDICLGECTEWLETRTSLTRLTLDCCHLGTKASCNDWNSVPRLWPRLQIFHAHSSSGLTMTIAGSIFPQLPKLKELSLPRSMLHLKEERRLAQTLASKFAENGLPKIRIRFDCSKAAIACAYQDEEIQYESDGNSDQSSETSASTQMMPMPQWGLAVVDVGWDDNELGIHDDQDFDAYDDFDDDEEADFDDDEEAFGVW